ncbi:MAG: hypothetical protein WC975_01955 [Phycisphaerae bacterium]
MEHHVEKLIENDLRQTFEQMLASRVKRRLDVKPHPLTPNHHFAPVSSECYDLFRDGYFYGCVSLVQSVAEGLVKFLCLRNCWKPDKVFEKNVDKLFERYCISNELKEHLLQIWKERDNYHHMNQNIEKNHKNLEDQAREKLELLNKIESDIFFFAVKDGKIVPSNPKYWDSKNGKAPVFLRCM